MPVWKMRSLNSTVFFESFDLAAVACIYAANSCRDDVPSTTLRSVPTCMQPASIKLVVFLSGNLEREDRVVSNQHLAASRLEA